MSNNSNSLGPSMDSSIDRNVAAVPLVRQVSKAGNPEPISIQSTTLGPPDLSAVHSPGSVLNGVHITRQVSKATAPVSTSAPSSSAALGPPLPSTTAVNVAPVTISRQISKADVPAYSPSTTAPSSGATSLGTSTSPRLGPSLGQSLGPSFGPSFGPSLPSSSATPTPSVTLVRQVSKALASEPSPATQQKALSPGGSVGIGLVSVSSLDGLDGAMDPAPLLQQSSRNDSLSSKGSFTGGLSLSPTVSSGALDSSVLRETSDSALGKMTTIDALSRQTSPGLDVLETDSLGPALSFPMMSAQLSPASLQRQVSKDALSASSNNYALVPPHLTQNLGPPQLGPPSTNQTPLSLARQVSKDTISEASSATLRQQPLGPAFDNLATGQYSGTYTRQVSKELLSETSSASTRRTSPIGGASTLPTPYSVPIPMPNRQRNTSNRMEEIMAADAAAAAAAGALPKPIRQRHVTSSIETITAATTTSSIASRPGGVLGPPITFVPTGTGAATPESPAVTRQVSKPFGEASSSSQISMATLVDLPLPPAAKSTEIPLFGIRQVSKDIEYVGVNESSANETLARRANNVPSILSTPHCTVPITFTPTSGDIAGQVSFDSLLESFVTKPGTTLTRMDELAFGEPLPSSGHSSSPDEAGYGSSTHIPFFSSAHPPHTQRSYAASSSSAQRTPGPILPVNVLMLGTGEYTTGYVHGKSSASDKGPGVVAITMADLKRRQKADRLSMCGVNGTKFPGIRAHLKRSISDVYQGMSEAIDSIETYPAVTTVDSNAYRTAIANHSPGDVAIIFTPDNTHFDIAMEAIQRGMHVLITKPVVKTLHDHAALFAAAEKHNVLVCTEVHKRFDPMYVDARDKIRAGFGFPSHMVSYMSQPKLQLETFRDWAGKSSDISYYLNAHHIDYHEWVVGETSRPRFVTAVSATGVAFQMNLPHCEDTITLTVVWENAPDESGHQSRSTAVYTASWIAPTSDVHSQQRFFFMGQHGEVNIDQAHRGYSTSDDSKGYRSVNPLFMKYTPTDGQFSGQQGYGYRSLEAFIDAAARINAGKANPSDYQRSQLACIGDTFRTTAILEAGRRSLDEDCTIEIVYADAESFTRPTSLRRKLPTHH